MLAELPEWQRENVELASKILESDDYVALPSQCQIYDYGIMKNFAYAKDSDDLLNALQGKGAFRYFKDRVYDLGIEDEWYQFRDEAYHEKAKEWCDEHGIKYE